MSVLANSIFKHRICQMSKAPDTLRLTLSPRLSELTKIRNELDRHLRDRLFPDTVRNTLLVVTEEVLANIVRYGCCDEASDTIEIKVDQENAAVHMEFIDSGKPFNPLKEVGRVTAGQLVDNQDPGGIGVQLVRELTNQQEYTRKADRNHFRITKYILSLK
jgi:serine/threonine-protein kinase RsbW